MNDVFADATLTIDLDALAHNYQYLRNQAASAETAAVVKANAYGLGVGKVAPRLYREGCRMFFVATLDEAVELRSHLTADANIAVFHGIRPGQEEVFQEHELLPILNDLAQVKQWRACAEKRGQSMPAILHIDTGMNRLGLNIEEAEELARQPEAMQGIEWRYVMSHLACISQPDHPQNAEQLARFARVRQWFPGVKASLSNSGGVLVDVRYHHDLTRPGSALYGINSVNGVNAPLQSVATLSASVIQVRRVSGIRTVGYGATYEAKKEAVLATVPVGYADGYLRSLSNKGYGHVDGRKVPVIGRVSMDMVIMDISEIPESLQKVGTKIELLGKTCNVDDVARQAGTIGYEILTSLGARYERIYVGDETA